MGDSSAPGVRDFTLASRFAWATEARLVLLSSLFGVIVVVNLRGQLTLGSFTIRVGLLTLLVAFGLSGVYAWFLRARRHLRPLVAVQLIFDQAIWTVAVYLSGGATSGATSFYGISCLFGAVLAGVRGALLAWTSAAVFYIGLVSSLALGLLHAPPDQPAAAYSPGTQELISTGLVNALVLVIVALVGGTLSERLRTTGGQLVQAEARANQAEREALLGRLAAGLAHEIRNPLSSIAGSIRLLQTNPDLGGDDLVLCGIIDREAQRLNELVSDMLNLANPRRPECTALDLAAIAREVVELARHSGRGADDVWVDAQASALIPVFADGAMVRQLLWNLVRNAVQASSPGGTVTVTVTLSAEGQQAEICVIDHGVGIDADARLHLFDAFFTTRSQGTGIGLAVVKRIVDEHGWGISVIDTLGGGATFRVTLPTATKTPLGSKPPVDERWTLFPKHLPP